MTPQHATFFIDESGAKVSGGNFFVVAGIKCRKPGRLQRQVESLREREGFTNEFKFSKISDGNERVFRRLVEVVAAADIRVVGTVVDRSVRGNPFRQGDEEWVIHARIAARLIAGNMSHGEYVGAVVDHRSTKPTVSFADTVQSIANHSLASKPVVSVVSVDSKANDLLQVADLIAGAISNHRRNPTPTTLNAKGRVAHDLAQSMKVRSFCDDIRIGRVNIMTMTKMGRGRPDNA